MGGWRDGQWPGSLATSTSRRSSSAFKSSKEGVTMQKPIIEGNAGGGAGARMTTTAHLKLSCQIETT